MRGKLAWLQGNRGAVMTSYAVEVDSMAVLRVTKAEFDQLWDHIPNTLPQVELWCWLGLGAPDRGSGGRLGDAALLLWWRKSLLVVRSLEGLGCCEGCGVPLLHASCEWALPDVGGVQLVSKHAGLVPYSKPGVYRPLHTSCNLISGHPLTR